MATSTSTYADDGDDEAGYFGIAITRNQRIRKNMDRLYRLHHKMAGIQDEIDDAENKLESFGVDVDELYEGWNEADEDDDEDMAFDDYGPRRGRGGARAGAMSYGDPRGDYDDYEDEYDDGGPDDGEEDYDEDGEEDPREYGELAKSLFPKGSQQGRGFSGVAVVPASPWIAVAKYSNATAADIKGGRRPSGTYGAEADTPIGSYAKHAKRQLMDAAAKRGEGVPIWIYEQQASQTAFVYFIAAAEPIDAATVKRYGGQGIGRIKLVARANGAEGGKPPAVKSSGKKGPPKGGNPQAGARGAPRGGKPMGMPFGPG